LIADENNNIISRKPLPLRTCIDPNLFGVNNCNNVTNYNIDPNNPSASIDTALTQIKNYSWLTEELNIDIPKSINVQVGVSGIFFKNVDVNKDGICDRQMLNHDSGPGYKYPLDNFWSDLGDLTEPRAFHTITELDNKRLMVFGGANNFNSFGDPKGQEIGSGQISNPMEFYSMNPEDQTTFSWYGQGISDGISPTPRFRHTATKIGNGKVVIIGGYDSNNPIDTFVPEIDVFDPVTNKNVKFVQIVNSESSTYPLPAGLNSKLVGHTANWIGTNKILIVGGYSELNSEESITNRSIAQTGILTVKENQLEWQSLPNLQSSDASTGYGRYMHTTTILGDYAVVIGGISQKTNGTQFIRPDIYRIKLNQANPAWLINNSLQRIEHTATAIDSKKMLIIGGRTMILSNSTTGQIDTSIPSPLNPPLIDVWMLTLDSNGTPQLTLDGDEIPSMDRAHAQHSTLKLPNGSIMVIGGKDGNGPSGAIDVYDPNLNKWRQQSNKSANVGFGAVIYNGNKIMVTGGRFTQDDGYTHLPIKKGEYYIPGENFANLHSTIIGHKTVSSNDKDSGLISLNLNVLHSNPIGNYLDANNNDIIETISNKKDWVKLGANFSSCTSPLACNGNATLVSVTVMANSPDRAFLYPLNQEVQASGQLYPYLIPSLFPLRLVFKVSDNTCYISQPTPSNDCGLYEAVINKESSPDYNHSNGAITTHLIWDKRYRPAPPPTVTGTFTLKKY